MNKKNLLLLALVIVLAVVFWFSRDLEYEENRINFFNIDSTKIAQVEITSSFDTLKFAKKNDNWMIEFPKPLRMNEKQVSKFFAKFIGVSVSELPISEDIEHQSMFQVDSTGTVVKLYSADGSVLSEVVYGRSGRPDFGYLKKANDNNIYLTDDIFDSINPRISNWRNSEILEVQQEDLQKLAVVTADRGFEISRTDSNWVYTDESENFAIPFSNKKLLKVIGIMQNFKSYIFFDNEFEKYKDKLAKPDVQIMIEEINGETTLLRASEIEDNKYVLQLNDEKDVLYQALKSQITRFIPSAESLKKAN